MSEDAARFVGSIPQHYDRGLAPVMFAPYAKLTAERVAAAPAARVLELAAGTGAVTLSLRERLAAEVEIVATDLNAPMLEIARAKLAGAANVSFATADAQALPYPDATFDALVCQFGVMFFPDKAKAFAEARRTLRPGGRYLFSVWDAPEANPFTGVVADSLRELMPVDTPRFMETPFGFSAIDPMRAALHAAGFARIAIEVLPVLTPLPDIRGFAEGQVLGSPMAEQIRARGVAPEALIDALAARMQTRFGAAGAMPLRAILFTAYA